MKGKLLAGTLAGATIATGSIVPVLNNINSTTMKNSSNEVLLSKPVSTISGQEAVVINGNNNLVLFNNSDGQSVNSYLSTGEMLTILGHEGNYYKVEVHETGAVGYIFSDNLQVIESGLNSEFHQNITDGSIINVSTRVHLRAQPDLQAGILKNLKENTSVEILGNQGQWIKVNVNGTIGYIYETYVSLNQDNNTLNTVSSTSTSSSSISTGSNINTNTNINNDTNVYNNINKNVNTDTISSSNNISSSSSTGSSTKNDVPHNSHNIINNNNDNIKLPEVSKVIPINASAYIKAAPNVQFYNGTNLETNPKTITYEIKQLDNVTVLNKQNNYYEVKLSNGTVGLVNQDYIVFSGNSAKSDYLNKLNNLSIKTYNLFATPTAQQSQTNMNIYSGQCAEMWEHQLKDMYEHLLNVLPQNKAEQLKESQNQFNMKVNNTINEVSKAYEGGSILPLMDNIYYEQLIQQRCFELVNEYPELYSSNSESLNTNNSHNTVSNENNKVDSATNATANTNTNTNTEKETSTSSTNNTSKNTVTNKTISTRTKTSENKNINTKNNNEINNSTSKDNVVNVKTGEGYSYISKNAVNHQESTSNLDNLIYTYINDTFAPCRNYVSYNKISNIVNHGTEAQKEALIKEYGSTCLVINLNSTSNTVTPEVYYNGQYYFKFTCTNLYSLINNPSNTYNGIIDANGNAPSMNTYKEAVSNHEVFSLGSQNPTWVSSGINC